MRSLGAKIDCSTIESVTYPSNPSFGCSNEIALSRAERPVDRNSIGPVAVAGQDSELDGNGKRPQDARSVSERERYRRVVQFKGNGRCTTASRRLVYRLWRRVVYTEWSAHDDCDRSVRVGIVDRVEGHEHMLMRQPLTLETEFY